MERPILYVNACVRKESRTQSLAEKLLSRLGGPYEELRLAEIAFPAVDRRGVSRSARQAPGRGRFSEPALCPCAAVFRGGDCCDRGAVLGSLFSGRAEAVVPQHLEDQLFLVLPIDLAAVGAEYMRLLFGFLVGKAGQGAIQRVLLPLKEDGHAADTLITVTWSTPGSARIQASSRSASRRLMERCMARRRTRPRLSCRI